MEPRREQIANLADAYPSLVTVVASAGEVIDACAVTYSMLSTLEASEAVFPSILKSIKQGKSLVDCATLTPERMQTMASAVEIAQGRFLEAPVSSSKAPAAQGALIFLCGGDKSFIRRMQARLTDHGQGRLLLWSDTSRLEDEARGQYGDGGHDVRARRGPRVVSRPRTCRQIMKAGY